MKSECCKAEVLYENEVGFCKDCGEEVVSNKKSKMADQTDTVNHPAHYTAGKVECIDAIEAATTGLEGIQAVCTGNVIKYVWRWKRKNGVEDLLKARWYLDKLIEETGAVEHTRRVYGTIDQAIKEGMRK